MVEVAPFVIADQLHTKEHCTEYIKAVAELDDLTTEMFIAAYDDVIRSPWVRDAIASGEIADTDLIQAAADGKPLSFDMAMKLTRILGQRLAVIPIGENNTDGADGSDVPLSPAV